jgi:hypothetical protein
MLLFVSFLPKMCPQLLQGSTFSLLMAADPRGSDHVNAPMPLPRGS